MGSLVAWIALSLCFLIIVYLVWDRTDSWKQGEDVVRRVLREWRADTEKKSDG